LTAYDVLKQHGLTSICGTSGVMKVSALRAGSLSSMQRIARARRAHARR
jgi:hypothetical protein